MTSISITLISVTVGCLVNSSRSFSRSCSTDFVISNIRTAKKKIEIKMLYKNKVMCYLCKVAVDTKLCINLKLFVWLPNHLMIEVVLLVVLFFLRLEMTLLLINTSNFSWLRNTSTLNYQ